jgi:cysteine protease ATG4
MSSKNKGTASPHGSSKLPKFLQKQNKDRSRSTTEDSTSSSSSSPASSSSSSSSAHLSNTSKPPTRSSSRLEGQRDNDAAEEVPVLVEPSAPLPIPRPRTRSERRVASDVPTSVYASTATSPSSGLPSRLSGWLSHTFNSSSSSSNDLSLPSLLTQQSVGSPKAKSSGTNPLLMVARHGKGHLDKAMRYLLDSDATPDKCTDPIWLLGVQHPGYEPPPPPPPPSLSASTASITPTPSRLGRRASVDYSKHPPPSPARGPNELSQSVPPSAKSNQKDPGAHWSPVFYSDFTTRIWCTYRSHFQPIRDTTLAALDGDIQEAVKSSGAKKWSWAALAGEKGWTSDSGWGCMLRTGQSLLANTLLHMHLGRGMKSCLDHIEFPNLVK